MNYFIILNRVLLISFFLLTFFTAEANPSIKFSAKADTLPSQIEDKIFQAFVNAQMKRNTNDLRALGEQLEKLHSKQNNPLAAYWLAYTKYYECIFYMNAGEEDKAKGSVKAGIKILESKEEKNTEDYALLAYMQSLSIAFASTFKAIGLSSKVKKNGNKALALDAQNLRAYLVLGSNDFYTPEKYGGGKKVEEYLLQAIKLPEQKAPNPYLPSWGKNSAYELLIKFYLRKDRIEDAKGMYKTAIGNYPDDYMLNKLAKELL